MEKRKGRQGQGDRSRQRRPAAGLTAAEAAAVAAAAAAKAALLAALLEVVVELAAGRALGGGAAGAGHVDGLLAAVVRGLHKELDGLALAQRAEALGHDGGLRGGGWGWEGGG